MSDEERDAAGEGEPLQPGRREATETELATFMAQLDWRAWPAQAPAADFAQRVVQRARPSASRAASVPVRGARWSVAGSAIAVALGVWLWLAWPSSESAGEHVASTRMELAIGERALAVLEAGAELSWRGDRVSQRRGDVFYRVATGTTFLVSTPAGSVEVLGTCFRVVSDGVLTRVRVYEGRVRASASGQTRELAAGAHAELGADGVQLVTEPQPAPPVASPAAAGDAEAEARAAAVQRLRERLGSVEHQKAELEKQLRAEQARLRAARGEPPERHRYDLSREDWKELAKTGGVMFRIPCARDGYEPSAEQLDELGLMPEDAPILSRAYAASRQRLWRVLRPLCAAAVGSERVADLLDREGCTTAIQRAEERRDAAASAEAMRQVAEIRAGLRAAPAAGEPLHPVLATFLALTGEPALFEAELAQSFGPEDARRLTFNDVLCREQITLAGPGPRKD